jgi:hypothetical protein
MSVCPSCAGGKSPFGIVRDGRCIHCCAYCGLVHKDVEAAGIYHCPNVACPGPGAASWRAKLASYREVENDRHTVDPLEVIDAARARLHFETDETIKAAVCRSVLSYWSPLVSKCAHCAADAPPEKN